MVRARFTAVPLCVVNSQIVVPYTSRLPVILDKFFELKMHHFTHTLSYLGGSTEQSVVLPSMYTTLLHSFVSQEYSTSGVFNAIEIAVVHSASNSIISPRIANIFKPSVTASFRACFFCHLIKSWSLI